eukprot:TRINITY_DN2251_c0_g2_i7.p1 TRINITY_DN2251_c0_g2~~TRINITY_DN2251_c0_g2_i7.p1  ORF type:complete len:353 (+),score=31.56 TRINITY_DN2251_c0_g2_i7:192-1250(+)
MLSRYSLVSRLAGKDSTDLPVIKFRFIISSPSTFLYPDSWRLSTSAYSCVLNSSTLDACPTQPLFLPTYNGNISCPSYNSWPYGIQPVTDNNNYVSKYPVDSSTLITKIVYANYIFVVGSSDTKVDSQLDTSCAANAQGGLYRYQRTLTYIAYMHRRYGINVRLLQPNCAYSELCCLTSYSAALSIFTGVLKPIPSNGTDFLVYLGLNVSYSCGFNVDSIATFLNEYLALKYKEKSVYLTFKLLMCNEVDNYTSHVLFDGFLAGSESNQELRYIESSIQECLDKVDSSMGIEASIMDILITPKPKQPDLPTSQLIAIIFVGVVTCLISLVLLAIVAVSKSEEDQGWIQMDTF